VVSGGWDGRRGTYDEEDVDGVVSADGEEVVGVV
jgi:hypothetical protein